MIDSKKYGVSFSLKQCRSFNIDPKDTFDWLIGQGWRRFRLMTYWDEHEKVQGSYDFNELDWQLEMVAKAGGVVTLCLGVKQPRWPEYHWPSWTRDLSQDEITAALLLYIEKVITHVKHRKLIVSYQLENEAVLTNFGEHIHIDRRRLRAEFDLVKRIDPTRPIIMSMSNGWGIPLRRPIPDIVGFSLYTIMYKNGRYTPTIQKPWLFRLRAWLIRIIWHRPSFIHELQMEPWGPKAIWEMTTKKQAESMNKSRLAANMTAAQKTNLYPIDLWGAEWWYWHMSQNKNSTLLNLFKKN